MVEVHIEGPNAIFEVQASHRFWALKSRLEIPLQHIKSVREEPNPPMGWFHGLKMMGTDMPHFFRAGTFWLDGGRVFFDVRHVEKTIVVELADESYHELVVEVDDPGAVVKLIQQAIAG